MYARDPSLIISATGIFQHGPWAGFSRAGFGGGRVLARPNLINNSKDGC
jgi:hypothetical protein